MKLGYAILYVADVKKTIEFWEEAFGLSRRMLSEHGEYGELDTGTTTLSFASHQYIRGALPSVFGPSPAGQAPPPFEIALTTDDVEGAQARALRAGAELVLEPTRKPWGQIVAYVRDRDGNLVELCTPMG